MTDIDILTAAINKATAGGWAPWNVAITVEPFDDTYCVCIDGSNWPLETIIFNHDFAKALWRDPIVVNQKQIDRLNSGKTVELTKKMKPFKDIYKAHLMQMVVAEDPIKYLGDNI